MQAHWWFWFLNFWASFLVSPRKDPRAPFPSIIGNARVMGAFIVALSTFLRILMDRFLLSGSGGIT
jgi:hypothetical protein